MTNLAHAAADHIIASMTEHGLRDFLLKLVLEPSVAHTVKTRLFAQERTVLETASFHITFLSSIKAMDAKERAIAAKGTARFSQFSEAMMSFLAEIEWLVPASDALGGLGLDLAWGCLVNVADHAIFDTKAAGRPMLLGEEADNDGFHYEIDDTMVDVCQKQAAALHVDWKRRMKALDALKDKSAGLPSDSHLPRLDYRYAQTCEFLETLLDGKEGKKGLGGRTTSEIGASYTVESQTHMGSLS